MYGIQVEQGYQLSIGGTLHVRRASGSRDHGPRSRAIARRDGRRRAVCSAGCTAFNGPGSRFSVRNLGFSQVDPSSIQKMDAVVNIPILLEVGRAAAEHVSSDHFGSFLNIDAGIP
jgi:hypothetical protein